MGMSAEITQDMFRSAERLLGIDDPIVAEQYSQPRAEGMWVGKRQQVAVELDRACMKGVAESSDKLAAKDAAEHADGQEEGVG